MWKTYKVLQYTPDGHHDGQSRILTVIYYLNGVGGTYGFPLAQTSDEVSSSSSRDYEPRNKKQALDIGKDLEPGKDGLLIKGGSNNEIREDAHEENVAHIKMGDALAFYTTTKITVQHQSLIGMLYIVVCPQQKKMETSELQITGINSTSYWMSCKIVCRHSIIYGWGCKGLFRT